MRHEEMFQVVVIFEDDYKYEETPVGWYPTGGQAERRVQLEKAEYPYSAYCWEEDGYTIFQTYFLDWEIRPVMGYFEDTWGTPGIRFESSVSFTEDLFFPIPPEEAVIEEISLSFAEKADSLQK